MTATAPRPSARRRPDAAASRRLPLRRGHGGVPDRGRGARGRARRVDLGSLLAQARRGRQRRHRRRRLRPLPPLGGRPRPDGRARARVLPLLDRLAARAARRARAASNPRGRRLLPAARRGAARARDRADRDALPLGPAAGAAGGRRLGGARHRASASPSTRRSMADALGDVVEGWITHNEPWVVAFLGHADGRKAPGHPRLADGAARRRTTCCCRTAWRVRRAARALATAPGRDHAEPEPDPPPAPARPTRAARRMDAHQNRWFLDPVLRGTLPGRHARALRAASSGRCRPVRDGTST